MMLTFIETVSWILLAAVVSVPALFGAGRVFDGAILAWKRAGRADRWVTFPVLLALGLWLVFLAGYFANTALQNVLQTT